MTTLPPSHGKGNDFIESFWKVQTKTVKCRVKQVGN